MSVNHFTRLIAFLSRQILILSLTVLSTYAQTVVQNIRGVITDQQSRSPLSDATIIIEGTDLKAATAADGSYLLSGIPLGRVNLQISHPNYREQSARGIALETAKETILNIELLEKVHTMEAVTVKARRESITSLQMATVSNNEFDVEKTRRYSGNRNDVSRMAANFAGAATSNDGRNDIIIRGNSPSGLLWRLEGIDIPNPNHFGSLGATGGPVSMVNNNVLAKSAFYTGAFPAQFGNAIGGAFDLHLREGNKNRREYIGQIGVTGFELGAEGYFVKDKNASYLINYRYSVPGLLKLIGLNMGTGSAVPYYQDLSYNIVTNVGKRGKLSFFGIGGISNIDFKGDLKDTNNLYSDPYTNLKYATKMGTTGLSYQQFLSNTASFRITAALTGAATSTRQDTLDRSLNTYPVFRGRSAEWKQVVTAVFNKKFSSKNRITSGIIFSNINYQYSDSIKSKEEGFVALTKDQGNMQLAQAYVQWQHRFSDRLTLNSGLYGQYLFLNNSYSVEPRIGLRQATSVGDFTLAYGLHSQMQLLLTYFLETETNGKYAQTNRDLGFTKSHHFVAGWERTIFSDWSAKVEAYYQSLFNIPVEQRPTPISTVNLGGSYYDGYMDSLVNRGTGTNYGLELTLEKPFSKGYYVMTTGSLFQSTYKGSDGIQRNTAFNGNYVVNVLGGKEWSIRGPHVIALDLKLTTAGGKYFTPINLEASRQEHKTVYETDRAFSERTKDYFRADVKLTYRQNGKRVMHEWYLDLQNITNQKNVFAESYDNFRGVIRTQYQLGFTFNFNYRIQF